MSERALPRASLADVILGRAPIVGARFDPDAPRGFVSPVEARVTLGIPYGDLEQAERDYLQSKARDRRSDAQVLLRALVARGLPAGAGRLEDRPAIVSAEVDNLTIEQALLAIVAPAPSDRARLVFFVHPHALNLAAFDRSFAEVLARADVVLPDGVGIRLAAATLGLAMRHNINGTESLAAPLRKSAGPGRSAGAHRRGRGRRGGVRPESPPRPSGPRDSARREWFRRRRHEPGARRARPRARPRGRAARHG